MQALWNKQHAHQHCRLTKDNWQGPDLVAPVALTVVQVHQDLTVEHAAKDKQAGHHNSLEAQRLLQQATCTGSGVFLQPTFSKKTAPAAESMRGAWICINLLANSCDVDADMKGLRTHRPGSKGSSKG